MTVADVLVPVAHAPERRLAVVGVHGHQPIEANLPVEFRHRQLTALRRGDVVAHRQAWQVSRQTRTRGSPPSPRMIAPSSVQRRADARALARVVLDDEELRRCRRAVEGLAHLRADLIEDSSNPAPMWLPTWKMVPADAQVSLPHPSVLLSATLPTARAAPDRRSARLIR